MNRPSFNNVDRVAIIGAGLIGSGWAALFLARGMQVVAIDPAPGAEQRLRRQVAAMVPVLADIGLVSDRADFDRLIFRDEPDATLADVQLVQENLPEKLSLKQEMLAQLEAIVDPDIVIASSTSALKISDIQANARHPQRCIAAHPFNPSHLMPLVEISGGDLTAPDAIDWAMAFFAHIGKQPVRLNRDIEGHIAGRLGAALWREAVSLVDEGIASVADIDAAVRFGPGLRWATMGPHLTYHLGGGDGGIRAYLDHLGASQQKRWDSLGTPSLTSDLKDKVVEGVLEEADGRSIEDLGAERDRLLVAAIKAFASQ